MQVKAADAATEGTTKATAAAAPAAVATATTAAAATAVGFAATETTAAIGGARWIETRGRNEEKGNGAEKERKRKAGTGWRRE